MISTLLIKDYALIEKIEVEFERGLNIITGETGAGKSILIGALGLLLGERANSSIVRKGALKAIIEGTFDVSVNNKVERLLTQNNFDYENQLIIRREISSKGNNRCFVNDTPASLQFVKYLGDLLIDLHGQHEHQSLLKTDQHILFLNEISDEKNKVVEFQDLLNNLNKKVQTLNELKQQEKLLYEKKELYDFQLKEIDEVSPKVNEDDEIENQICKLENGEYILTSTSMIYNALYDSEEAVIATLNTILKKISELSSVDKVFLETEKDFSNALLIIEDIAEFVRTYKDRIEIDPEQLEELRLRSTILKRLKKKYGATIKAVIEYRNEIEKKIELSENFSERINLIQDEIFQLRKKLGEVGGEISIERKKTASEIEKRIEESLRYLGMPDSEFKIKFLTKEAVDSNFLIFNEKELAFNKYGFDFVEFHIKTNAGEDLLPLSKIASGGEISRIMLALKTILAKNDKLPLLVFDEIDTGVSGRIAQKVGLELKKLAKFHQIIAITHLPQIAALADVHFTVEKENSNNRVTSKIKKLNIENRITEVAKLISGQEITDATLDSAKQLMNIQGTI